MTNGEIQAVLTADEHLKGITQSNQLKALGEEVVEFIEAVLVKSEDDILEEAGDICYIILHILSKRIDHSKVNLTQLVVGASDKLEMRIKTGYYDK